MIPLSGVKTWVVLFRVTKALPWATSRYSVWLSCQWRPDVQVDFGGRVMVTTGDENGGDGRV